MNNESGAPDEGITDANLRLFAAGRLPEDSAEYKEIEADLIANPENGRTALYIKQLEQFGETGLNDVNWGNVALAESIDIETANVKHENTKGPIAESTLIEYLTGGLGRGTRQMIERQRAIVGSPVQKWFATAIEKLQHPFGEPSPKEQSDAKSD